MSPRSWCILLTTSLLLAGIHPLAAQGRRGPMSGASNPAPRETGFHRHGRGHEFDFRAAQESSVVLVFGWGFDAHHFFVTQPRSRLPGFPLMLDSGLERFRNTPEFIFVPTFPLLVPVPSVIIVQQIVPVELLVPAIIMQDNFATDPWEAGGAAGDSARLRLAPDSFPPESPQLPPLTLLVLPGNTIVAAAAYWLEGEQIIFLTLTGTRGSAPFDELDWEMTAWLNAERGREFVLRSR